MVAAIIVAAGRIDESEREREPCLLVPRWRLPEHGLARSSERAAHVNGRVRRRIGSRGHEELPLSIRVVAHVRLVHLKQQP